MVEVRLSTLVSFNQETRSWSFPRFLRTSHVGQLLLLWVCYLSYKRMARKANAIRKNLLRRTNWNLMSPSSLSGRTGHRKCGCYKRLKQKSSLSQITGLSYTCRPKDNLPYAQGPLPLYPVCSEDWARAVDETETAGKHLSSESLWPSAHVIPVTPRKNSKVLLIFGIIQTEAWGHWPHWLIASLK